MSALTATGSTVLTGLDALPVSVNVWRCFLQLMGGLGIMLLVVAVLPLLGLGGVQLYKAETPGPMKDARLTPRIAETARGLWGVYFSFSALCMLSYRWVGMSWEDAFMHMCTTMGLGGSSSHDASFGYWNSAAVEGVATFFMALAGVMFVVATRPSSWMVPVMPPMLTKSPTLNGRSTSMKAPAAKLPSMPLQATPMATPAPAISAAKLVVWMPK